MGQVGAGLQFTRIVLSWSSVETRFDAPAAKMRAVTRAVGDDIASQFAPMTSWTAGEGGDQVGQRDLRYRQRV